MRKPLLPLLCLMILLALLAPATLARAASRTSVIPPGQAGNIFVVINYPMANGQAQHTYLKIDWGSTHKTRVIAPPYGICGHSSPAGIVFKIRPTQSSSVPMTITTNGTIVRGPIQGQTPIEVLSACYKLMM
jgi:hypothetical protein